jgi:uncharacterized protein YcfJ
MKFFLFLTGLLLSSTLLLAETTNTIVSDISYVKVTHSEPIYANVSRTIPREVCSDQQVAVQQPSDNGIAGGILGAVVGGVLGHQVGGGSGKVAATIGGAAVGTMMGQNATRTNGQIDYQTVRQCTTQYDTQNESVITGYMNYAKFKGRDIAKASDRPLKEIKVTSSFSF